MDSGGKYASVDTAVFDFPVGICSSYPVENFGLLAIWCYSVKITVQLNGPYDSTA